MKSDMADYVWCEMAIHQALWNEVTILDKKEHWRV